MDKGGAKAERGYPGPVWGVFTSNMMSVTEQQHCQSSEVTADHPHAWSMGIYGHILGSW